MKMTGAQLAKPVPSSRPNRISQSEPSGNLGRLGALIILVTLIVLAVHWPVLSAQARSMDDNQYLSQNRLVRNPSWNSVGRFFGEVLEPSTVDAYYHPLTMISLMLDYAAGGRPHDLRAFHRTNLCLHAANTALVILLLYALFGQPWPAALAGLLFGLHPLTVEPLAWLSDRKTLLAAFFAFSSLALYVRFARRAGRLCYAGSMLTYVAALLSKPTPLLLPGLFLLLDFWPCKRLTRRALVEKIPFFVLGAAFAVIVLVSQQRAASIVPHGEHFGSRIVLRICYLVPFYMHKMVWPVDLTSIYLLPDPLALSNPIVLVSSAVTCVVILALGLSLLKTRALGTGWMFFFVAILPTVGVVQQGWLLASDKYVYLPAVGVLLVVTWLASIVWSYPSNTRQAWIRRGALVVVVALLGVAEARATRRYLSKWQETEGFVRYMLNLTPSVPALHHNLANALRDKGRLDEALAEYREAARLVVDSPFGPEPVLACMIHGNLGSTLAQLGDVDAAILHWDRGLSFDPHNAQALNNVGIGLAIRGKTEQAIAQFRESIRMDPDFAQTHGNLGRVLVRQGRIDEGVVHLQEARRLDPHSGKVRRYLGAALAQQGEVAEAVKEYREALRIQPRDADTYCDLGDLLESMGRVNESVAEYRRALQLYPGHQRARRQLEEALTRLNGR